MAFPERKPEGQGEANKAMKRQLLSNMLAAIAALFIAMFALPQTVQAQKISILGTDYYKSSEINLTGGGTIKWDKENTTLTLHNVVLDNLEKNFVYVPAPSGIKDLKVVLEGKNTINTSQYLFFWKDCDMTIQGSGSLIARTTQKIALYNNNTSPQ